MTSQSGTTPRRLAELFQPRSVALVGATDRSMWSTYTYANLRAHSPGIRVHVVHPSKEIVHGQRTERSLSAIDRPVDLAFMMVPTEAILEVVAEAADVGIRNVVILTAGFGEAGPHGADLERSLIDLARERDLTVLGPNGNGFINAAAAATPYGLPISPPLVSGPVGIVLQSGGLASAVLAGAQAKGIGLSTLVSTGNEALTSATDIMRYLIADPQTRVVAAFLEAVRQPEDFRQVAEEALQAGKPLVVFKVGRSEAGTRAALAHTGALAGDDRIIDAAFRQLGVVRVGSLEEMLVTAGYLGYHPAVRGRRMAAVTPSGGACDILADRASDEGLELPEFDDETLAHLTEVLPAFCNPHNPLDVTGYVVVDPGLARHALQVVGRHARGRYDMVVYLTAIPKAAPADRSAFEARYDELAEVIRTFPVPVVLANSLSGDLSPFGAELLSRRGLFVLDGIDQGVRAIGHAARYHERRDGRAAREVTESASPVDAPAGATGGWTEQQVRSLLAGAGIPVIPATLATTAAEAASAAGAFGGAVVLKVVSPEILHKSDVGGVRLEVAPDAAGEVFTSIISQVGRARPDARLEGVLVVPQRPPALEMLVGVTTDEGWGKVLTVGLGGIWVEVLEDVSLRVLPVDRSEVQTMLEELRGISLLRGARGATPVDLDLLVDVIHRIARLAEGLGEVLEVNPLRVDEGTVEALDALAIWR